MSDFDDLIRKIDDGREGKAIWIPIGFPKMGKFVGITPNTYSLFAGDPGSGKTSFVDQGFILNPYEWVRQNGERTDIRLEIVYRSMERSKIMKLGKWVCLKLYEENDVLVDVPTVFGWGEHRKRLPDAVYDWIKAAREYYERMLEHVDLIDGAENPTGIYRHAVNKALEHGTFIDAAAKEGQIHIYKKGARLYGDFKTKPEILKFGKEKLVEITVFGKKYQIKPHRRYYIQEDPRLVLLLVKDHIGRCKREQGLDDKGIIDKSSEYDVILRDVFGYSIVNIQQFNRGMADTNRMTKGVKRPMKSDFKGSGNTFEDADNVMCLFNPWSYEILTELGYKIPEFVNKGGYNRYRSVHVLKNSYGIDNVAYGMNFVGEVGHFTELPIADSISDYKKYANLTAKSLC